ncbi:AAA family ATPase [Vulcanococcus limneticus]|uniref:AAA family ATPase n=1 Tax=Vulcanococcus limneticus TaxID=2170428 RepID=UPI00398BFF61
MTRNQQAAPEPLQPTAAQPPAAPPAQTQGPGPLATALLNTLPRLYGGAGDPLLLELIAALAGALERGALELELAGPAPAEVTAVHWPEGHRRALEASPLVVPAEALAQPGETCDTHPADPAVPVEAPLVLDGDRLRWRRWHSQLEAVLAALAERAAAPLEPPLPPEAIARAVATAAGHGLDPQQQRAVAALLRHRLVLLGGGPGTGKTSTVVQMLGAALAVDPQLRLHLAAPTGKAATRLQQALAAGAGQLDPAIAARLERAPCTTLHRLLESNGERFGRDRRHPLGLDLLVVDEVSMVDLPLMQALLDALPARCQLVLVGDPAQLAPVGPGAVLLELHRPARQVALGEAMVELTTTYRNNGALAQLAQSLRPGVQPAVAAPLRAQLQGLSPTDNLRWQRLPLNRPPQQALERLRAHQQRLRALALALAWPEAAAANATGTAEAIANGEPAQEPLPGGVDALLAELEACILLSPVRQGRWGVEEIHRQLLGESVGRPLQHWPLATPVLNQRNLPEQGLANGDIGVLVERRGERLVLFPGPRLLHPARLGGAEPALALTIHKSQGSQYGEVLLLMPPSRHWDPRLLYTGLTRARLQASLITPPDPEWLQP